MSTDNYYYIAKRGDEWRGTMCFASGDYTDSELEHKLEAPYFRAPSLVEAIRLAQDDYTEYGYYVEAESLDAE